MAQVLGQDPLAVLVPGGLAASRHGPVGRLVLRGQAVIGHVGEGELHGRPLAASGAAALHGVRHAGHQLLGREPVRAARGDLHVRLEDGCRRHGPAGAAGTLVRDVGGGVEPGPVQELRGQGDGLAPVRAEGAALAERHRPAALRRGHAAPAQQLLQLRWRPVRELVHAGVPEAVGPGVLCLHHCQAPAEVRKALVELRAAGPVAALVLVDEGEERLLVRGLWVHQLLPLKARLHKADSGRRC
mmetsp:Transcript_111136/g.325086  ORF Transcript_111136/g.325086 Transcript_111136/m.325086 type:complete len:243 (+) Transcript_111136:520-1248(+)